MNVLFRFVKVMLFTAVLAVVGVAAFAVFMYVSSGGHLRADVSQQEFASTLAGAIGMWFGVMFFVGFIAFVAGLPKKFIVGFGDREEFVSRMDAAARGVRYRPRGREGDLLTYRPPALSVLAEKITVELGRSEAVISAPGGLKKKLLKKLAAGA
ncbi:MAG TPA: hypothetical protein VE713_07545 [Pyrinomonadaceae bacterium]|jgi:hypothetical protein|nr:hypothetical protein [Pyrinomonadaceae bacterium]